MRRVLTITDHLAFHLAVARAVLAGGAMALLGAIYPDAFPVSGPGAWVSGLFGVLLLGAALAPPRSLRHGALLTVCAVLGAGAAALPGPWLSTAALSLCLGAAASLGGLSRAQAALSVLCCALLSLSARLLPPAVLGQSFVQDLPGQFGPLLAGMGVGLIIGSGALIRQVRVRMEPVDGELQALVPAAAPAAEDEIARLVTQALETFKESADALRPHPPALQAAEDLVKKIARFGKRWREIEDQARHSDRDKLQARLDDLNRRRDASNDEQTRGDYERAAAALTAQLDYLREIDRGRERAVARLHHQVATLERLRLSALRHRSIDDGKLGEELRGLVEDLSRAGQELDTAAEALAEVPN